MSRHGPVLLAVCQTRLSSAIYTVLVKLYASIITGRLVRCVLALNCGTHATRKTGMIHKEVLACISAMCDEKNVEYYTDLHRPTRFRQDT